MIQKSTRRAKFGQSSKNGPYDAQAEISHIQQAFPRTTRYPNLVQKLGKANAQRRQWLYYRKRHRERLSSISPSREGDDRESHLFTDLFLRSDQSLLEVDPGVLSSPSQDHVNDYDTSTMATSYHDTFQSLQPASIAGNETVSDTAYSATSASDLGMARITNSRSSFRLCGRPD